MAESFYAAMLNMGEENRQKVTVASAIKTEMKVKEEEILETEESRKWDKELMVVMKFLATMEKLESLDEKGVKTLVACATKYFISGGQLWRKNHTNGQHQLVVFRGDKY